jgi:hypothetical protein
MLKTTIIIITITTLSLCRIVLENFAVHLQEILLLYGTQLFITMFTKDRYLILSWESGCHSKSSYHSYFRSISNILDILNGLFLFDFLNKNCLHASRFSHTRTLHMLHSSGSLWFNNINKTGEKYKICLLPLCYFLRHSSLADQSHGVFFLQSCIAPFLLKFTSHSRLYSQVQEFKYRGLNFQQICMYCPPHLHLRHKHGSYFHAVAPVVRHNSL